MEHPVYKSPVWKIYGPYQRKSDLRSHVIAYDGTKRITISYPKYVKECELQRLLTSDEIVHHKNRIEFHNQPENLEIVNRTEHLRFHRLATSESFTCPVCGILFVLEGSRLSNYKSNRKRKIPTENGPYCSRSCSGKDNN